MASVAANMDDLIGHMSRLDITDTTDHARPSPVTETSARTRVTNTPTLFNNDLLEHANVPRYLFRAFDSRSSSKSDGGFVESQASLSEADTYGRDLLSQNELKAAKMLFNHLKWKIPGPDDAPHNLSSWTSSLLFAIQGAIYRCDMDFNPMDPRNVKICVVDTTKFPQGQFAPATQLIKKFVGCVQGDPDISDFFDFRLNVKRYNNGEYLSQGRVSLTGRCWTVSLDSLRQSGLSNLYPEFDDEQGRRKWANRTLELRRLWSPKQYTSGEEFRTALDIARGCFPADVATQMALMLLCFKDRMMRTQATSTFFNLPLLPTDWTWGHAKPPQKFQTVCMGHIIHKNRSRSEDII